MLMSEIQDKFQNLMNIPLCSCHALLNSILCQIGLCYRYLGNDAIPQPWGFPVMQMLLDNWPFVRRIHQLQVLLDNWPFVRGNHQLQVLLDNWPFVRGIHQLRVLLNNWPFVRGIHQLRVLLDNWPFVRGIHQLRVLLDNWPFVRGIHQLRVLLDNWPFVRGIHQLRVLLDNSRVGNYATAWMDSWRVTQQILYDFCNRFLTKNTRARRMCL